MTALMYFRHHWLAATTTLVMAIAVAMVVTSLLVLSGAPIATTTNAAISGLVAGFIGRAYYLWAKRFFKGH